MKKYLLIAPFLSLSLLMSCSAKTDNAVLSISDSKVQIFFDAGEGIYDDGLHVHSLKILPGYTWEDVKRIAPTAADINCGESIFNGWLLNGMSIDDNYSFKNKYTVLNADYTIVHEMKITINPNGGQWTDGTKENKTITAFEGDTWGKYYDSYLVKAENPAINEFKYWALDSDGKQPIDENHLLLNGETIYAVYGLIGTTTNFETDSWPVFINALNKGFEFVAKTEEGAPSDKGGYANAFNSSKEGKAPGTFVGLERTITIYNRNYKVRVIDENVDPLTSSSEKATLTFQFVDAIENAVGWDSSGNSVYETSSIRSYLNDQFIDAFPDDIIDGIAEVKKLTYEGGGWDLEVKEYSEKIFLPSLRELGIEKFKIDVEKTTTSQEEGINGTNAYKYYQHDGDVPSYDKIKKMYKGIECNYWLRSPDDEANGGAWWIDRNGNVAEEKGIIPGSVQYGFAIAPCFAIGSKTV